MKIDPSRLRNLSQIRSQTLGAISKLTDMGNALNRQRNEARALIASLEDRLKSARDETPIRAQLATAKADLAKIEADFVANSAALESARERSTMAGTLFRACEEFAEGRTRA